MLLSKEVEVTTGIGMDSYYESKGYIISKYYNKSKKKWFVKKGTKITVKIEDLSPYSNMTVLVVCDNCGKELKSIKWQDYNKCVKEDGKYYCHKCSHNLFSGENLRKTKLKKSKSFEQWCIENQREDVLLRWDSKLNNCKPNEISYSSNKKYYFKCPRGLHESELKIISSITREKEGSLNCNKCNSFAQWGIDNICEDFLEKYWDFDKNNKLEINPWEINHGVQKKVWIKCQDKKYHESYETTCCSFSSQGNRCPYCRGLKVHMLDSLGTLHPKVLLIWSDKNKKSPYEYTPFSYKKVWFQCSSGSHDDYLRHISSSNTYNFRCPECQYSKGEQRISEYLTKNSIKYIPQKEYNDLLGINNGQLSYDFYLPQYNLLIEYQGEQHKKYIPGFHKSKKDFEKQVEHDKRKKEYAQLNNIKLLEIWYWDYDRIEEILELQLKKFSSQKSS